MPSPFPGMDPFLEDPAFWPDFHHTFIGSWREALGDALPDSYEARIDERVALVQLDPETAKLIAPDIAVSRRTSSPSSVASESGVALLEPETIEQTVVEETREAFIEILHRGDRSLVAVLELLSPTNKRAPGLYDYANKRAALLRQDVHLFELDLLRDGQSPALARPLPPGDYHALLTRAERRHVCHVYTWTMRQPLPTLPVPLRAPDADVLIDLQAVFAQTYERGRYARSLPYDKPLATVVSTADTAWLAARIAR